MAGAKEWRGLVGLTVINDWMVQQDDDRRTTENAAPQADRWCKAP